MKEIYEYKMFDFSLDLKQTNYYLIKYETVKKGKEHF